MFGSIGQNQASSFLMFQSFMLSQVNCLPAPNMSQSSLLMLCKKTNKHMSKNAKVLLQCVFTKVFM